MISWVRNCHGGGWQSDPGRYTVTWNADNFAGGVYYVMIRASDLSGRQVYSMVKRIILLK